MPPDRSADLLRDILNFIDRIESWIPADSTSAASLDEKTLYAVLHALQYIGEAVSRLPSTTTNLAPAGVARSRRCDAAAPMKTG